jgi:hypothetical protein
MMLLPEGQTGEAWEPSKKLFSFGNRGALDKKYFRLALSLKVERVIKPVVRYGNEA